MSDYDKLKKIVNEIPELIRANIISGDAPFLAWKEKTERFLARKYGEDSREFKKFLEIPFSLEVFIVGTPKSEFIRACKEGLETSKAIFENYLEEMEEESHNSAAISIAQTRDYKSVFIVHGHDGELKERVARLLEQQGINPIILSEQVSRGQTIIEKIESNSAVGGAICLFTADDYGRSKSSDADSTRARQNVVFETGFFCGKLGRTHIVILADNNVEMPSDLSGVVYTNTMNWQFSLLKEMKTMGYTVDMNKIQ